MSANPQVRLTITPRFSIKAQAGRIAVEIGMSAGKIDTIVLAAAGGGPLRGEAVSLIEADLTAIENVCQQAREQIAAVRAQFGEEPAPEPADLERYDLDAIDAEAQARLLGDL